MILVLRIVLMVALLALWCVTMALIWIPRSNYRRGFLDGLAAYAWWKDGVQYVGTCGTTLEKAIQKTADVLPAAANYGNLRHAAGVFVAATEHELEDAPAPVSEWFDDALGARYEELRKQVEQGGDDEKV